MKIEGNEKCHACLWILASVVFRYSGIPPLFRGVPVIPLVFRVPLFPVPVFRVVPSFRGCSVFRRSVFWCSWLYSMPFFKGFDHIC